MRPAVCVVTLLLAFSLASSVARADALPSCPDGQELVTNPVEEGAMHHNGGRCVEPGAEEGGEDGGGCSVTVARSGGASSLPVLLALLFARRRRGQSAPKRTSSIV